MTDNHVDSYYSRGIAGDRLQPALGGGVETQVRVIGGGMAGLATALGLAERGRKMVALEGRRLAWIASGRNMGMVGGGYSAGHRGPMAQGKVRCTWFDDGDALKAEAEWLARVFGAHAGPFLVETPTRRLVFFRISCCTCQFYWDIFRKSCSKERHGRVDFIFMLTRDDQTVGDCLEIFDSIKDIGVQHVGFKDLGVDRATLAALNGRIKAGGATSYMEVVSTTSEACLNSARTALEIGVDRLLGGAEVAPMLALLEGKGIAYYPFPGRPKGHPTRLCGGPEDVAADCRRMEREGCAGVDLLAYRAVDADPLALIRAARGALSGELIVAGSIDTPERVRALAEAGVDAFTIGTAAFDGSFSPRRGGLRAQLGDILAASAYTKGLWY